MKSDEESAEIRIARALAGEAAATAGPPDDARARRWRETWDELELPPAPAPDLGFAARVVAAAAGERAGGWGPALAPAWRAAALLALVAGAAGGYRLGAASQPPTSDETLVAWGGATLAEEYVGLGAAAGSADTGSADSDSGDSR